MENFTNLSKRIKEIIDYKGISINKFSTLVGTSNSYFNKILRDNNSVGSDKLEKILRTFPEINPEWLLTGQGSMLKGDQQASFSQPQQNDNEIISLLRDKITLLEKNNTLQEKEIQRLETHNQHLTHQLSVLEATTQPAQEKNVAG